MDDLRPRGMVRDGVPAESWPKVALGEERADGLDVSFVRRLDWERGGRTYLHAYDKTGTYLAACSSLELGLGYLRRHDNVLTRGRAPGYYRVDGRWMTAPTLRLLLDELAPSINGAPSTVRGILVETAYTWERHGRALRHWYERLRDARAILMHDSSPEGQLAYSAYKEGYTRAIGWLNGHWFYPAPQEDEEALLAPAEESFGLESARFRPDWRHAIMAQAAANINRTVTALGAECVAAGRVDALWLASNVADPIAAAEAWPALRLGTELGRYKVRYAGLPLAVLHPHFTPATTPAQLDRACAAVADWVAERERGERAP